MIHTRDHQTDYLFDPWDYLGPKRKKLLTESWAGVFREHILRELPVHKIAPYFPKARADRRKSYTPPWAG